MSKLFKLSKIKHAYEILKLVEVNLDNPEDLVIWIESYQNGRECGFAIKLYSDTGYTCCFSEYRNTDDIAVYTGSNKDFNINNIPKDKAWSLRKSFPYESYEEAANYIVDWIKDKVC